MTTHPLAALALSWQCVYPIAATIAGRDLLVCSGDTPAGHAAVCKCIADAQADVAVWSFVKTYLHELLPAMMPDADEQATACKLVASSTSNNANAGAAVPSTSNKASAGSAVVPSFLLATAACLAVLIAPRRFQ